MEYLFCARCFLQPTGSMEYFFTKCSHIFCATCLNTIRNKENSLESWKKICPYCKTPNPLFRKINKSLSEEERIKFFPSTKMIMKNLRINTFLNAGALQENQIKSMIKLSHEYDDTLTGLKKNYSNLTRELRHLKEIYLNKVNLIRELSKRKKKYLSEINKIVIIAKRKDMMNQRQNMLLSTKQFSMLQSEDHEESEFGFFMEAQTSFREADESYHSGFQKDRSESSIEMEQKSVLSKSFFD
uniref:RING-type domain-containing protein n=1 Tax=Strongyloides stercoralis TaxID=6248 RepID=A0A0K0DXT0_STRER